MSAHVWLIIKCTKNCVQWETAKQWADTHVSKNMGPTVLSLKLVTFFLYDLIF